MIILVKMMFLDNHQPNIIDIKQHITDKNKSFFF